MEKRTTEDIVLIAEAEKLIRELESEEREIDAQTSDNELLEAVCAARKEQDN